jgi:hypothetical protein
MFRSEANPGPDGSSINVTDLSTISHYERNPRKFVYISDDEHVVRVLAPIPKERDLVS